MLNNKIHFRTTNKLPLRWGLGKPCVIELFKTPTLKCGLNVYTYFHCLPKTHRDCKKEILKQICKHTCMGKWEPRRQQWNLGRWMEADVCFISDVWNPIKLHPKPPVGRAVSHSDVSRKIWKSCRKWYSEFRGRAMARVRGLDKKLKRSEGRAAERM